MGKVAKGVKCSVENCGSDAARSISRARVKGLSLRIKGERGRVYLCEGHWKEYKKAVKKEEKLEEWRRQG
jgi:hypothetical protein